MMPKAQNPHRIIAAACQKLDRIPPSEARVIGDTRFDMEAASKDDLPAIGVICGGTDEAALREAGARSVYRDPAHLLDLYPQLP